MILRDAVEIFAARPCGHSAGNQNIHKLAERRSTLKTVLKHKIILLAAAATALCLLLTISRPKDSLPGWVLRSGGFEAGITIRDFNLNSGVSYRGLAAKRHVRDNEVVVSIPMYLSLSAMTAGSHPLLGPVARNLTADKRIDEFSLLAVLLLLEASNATSVHRHYMCSLPKTFPLPLFWPAERVRESAYGADSRFLNAILSTGRVLMDTYLEASSSILDRHPEMFPKRPSFESWKWAAGVIMSRTWGVPVPKGSFLDNAGIKYMHVAMPLADLVNHRKNSRKVGVKEDGSIVIRAGGDLMEGDEVTITYGDKCNPELLNSYGFVLPDNQVTACEWDALVAQKLMV